MYGQQPPNVSPQIASRLANRFEYPNHNGLVQSLIKNAFHQWLIQWFNYFRIKQPPNLQSTLQRHLLTTALPP